MTTAPIVAWFRNDLRLNVPVDGTFTLIFTGGKRVVRIHQPGGAAALLPGRGRSPVGRVTDDDCRPSSRDRRVALRSALRPLRHKYDIDDYVVTRSDLAAYVRRGSPFVRKIISEGICIYMREATRAWRRQAEEERDTAAYLRTDGFHRSACYHAQQYVEKSVKTMLLEVGWELEKIHNIHRLTALAADHGAPVSLTADDIAFLDEIYRGRSPAESGLLPLGDPTSTDAERAVALAGNSFAMLNKFLAERSQPDGEGAG